MAGPADSDYTQKTSGRSTRQAPTLNEECHEWLGEQGEGEGENMMEMVEIGDVNESVEIKRECVVVRTWGRCTMYQDPGAHIISQTEGGFELGNGWGGAFGFI